MNFVFSKLCLSSPRRSKSSHGGGGNNVKPSSRPITGKQNAAGQSKSTIRTKTKAASRKITGSTALEQRSTSKPAQDDDATITTVSDGTVVSGTKANKAKSHGMFFWRRHILFPVTSTGKVSRVKIQLCNSSNIPVTAVIRLSNLQSEDMEWTPGKHFKPSGNNPFYIKEAHRTISLLPKKFCMLPVYFAPGHGRQSTDSPKALLSVQGTPDYSRIGSPTQAKGVKLDCEVVLVGEVGNAGHSSG